jgi:hypothetical protein
MPYKALTIVAGIVALAAMTTAANADDTAARCKSLAAQWDTAKVAKATNANFGKAKVWARTAAHDCARDEAQHRSDGIDEYIKALQLVGVTPH